MERSLESLTRTNFKSDFKIALGRLPSQLSGLYDIIQTQIAKTQTYGRSVATKTFKWLSSAQRLSSTQELVAAIYTAYADIPSNSDEDEDGEHVEELATDILRLCQILIVLDSEQGAYRFAHQSVRE